MRWPRPRRLYLLAAAVAVLIAATIFVAAAGKLAPVGLTVVATADSPGAAVRRIDTDLSSRSIERFSDVLGTRQLSIRWSGYLNIVERRVYEFEIASYGDVRFWIGQELVIERAAKGQLATGRGRVRLEPGLHRVLLENERITSHRNFQIRWEADNPHKAEPMPASAFVARRPPDWLMRYRAFQEPFALGVSAVWSLLLIAGGVIAIRRFVRFAAGGDGAHWSPRVAVAVIAGAAVLFLWGIAWGVPGEGWAPDELTPDIVLANGVFGDWPDKYPPLHFALLSAVYAPLLAAGALAAIDPWSGPASAWLVLAGRVLSVAMALGVVALVARVTAREFGARAAPFAALCAAAFLPFVYYAKIANLDVPYVFWFTLSLVFWQALRHDGRGIQYLAFGVTAALAVGTKDQAYGLYGLPAIVVLWEAWRRERWSGLRMAAAAGVAAGSTFALVHNIVFDIDGFGDHTRALLGTASTHYRVYPPTLEGQWHLARVSAGQLLAGPGVAGALATVTGLILAVRRIGSGMWLLAPVVSYFVTFTLVVGFQYDRFLLPIFVVLAVFSGVALEWAWSQGRIGKAIAAAIVVTVCVRAASVDVLLTGDSRYAVESWLDAHVEPGQTVGSFGNSWYVPRLARFRRWDLSGYISYTRRRQPDYVVVNVDYMTRFREGSSRDRWLAWLDRGAEYREVFRVRSQAGQAVLGRLAAFRGDPGPEVTNLVKAAAEYVVYRRIIEPAPE